MAANRYNSPRRADAAAATRAEILAAARELFVRDGYAETTVPKIARAAGVAVPTVYTSAGGKADILAALLMPIMEDPAATETASAVRATSDGAEIIRLIGYGTWQNHARHWDTVVELFPQARAEPAAAAVHDRILRGYQQAVGVIADRLAESGTLRAGLSRDDAHDILWFYFGAGAWPALVRDRGWSLERTRDWLIEAASRDLLSG
ncbi:TetR/AcrR family transcriptional regulator [Actinoplanes sp. L3-i22]|uniref:TetR/AcrR family transcriptional regulator n=1 Tax=Actinoplanes sp. L3-i22 TaxID=2836373 RepID=UPI001C85E69A|nr:TetR/AcrR family transcriptional regulator [Actinoplanes sp. L3-i22]